MRFQHRFQCRFARRRGVRQTILEHDRVPSCAHRRLLGGKHRFAFLATHHVDAVARIVQRRRSGALLLLDLRNQGFALGTGEAVGAGFCRVAVARSHRVGVARSVWRRGLSVGRMPCLLGRVRAIVRVAARRGSLCDWRFRFCSGRGAGRRTGFDRCRSAAAAATGKADRARSRQKRQGPEESGSRERLALESDHQPHCRPRGPARLG